MMKSRSLSLSVLATLALMAFTSSASATTTEIGGVKQTGAVTVKSSLKAGTSILLTDTFGVSANTCTASSVEGKTSTFTGTTVSGPLSALSFSSCTEGNPTVDTLGSVTVENIAGTTNGTIRSIGAKVTIPSPFGTLTCVTAASPGTDIGTATGVSSGSATEDVNAVLSCGITAKLTGTYTVTSPSGLGSTS